MTQVQSQDCLDLQKKSHKTFLQLRFPPSYFYLKKPALSGINRQWKPPCFKMSRWNREIRIIPIIITNRWQIILTSWTQPLSTPGLNRFPFKSGHSAVSRRGPGPWGPSLRVYIRGRGTRGLGWAIAAPLFSPIMFIFICLRICPKLGRNFRNQNYITSKPRKSRANRRWSPKGPLW